MLHPAKTKLIERVRSQGFRRKVEFPSLGRKVLSKAVMSFFADNLEARLTVNVSGCMEIALRPQGHLLVTCLTGEADTFRHQSLRNAESTR
jgi:hypothetical protein